MMNEIGWAIVATVIVAVLLGVEQANREKKIKRESESGDPEN